MYCGEFTDIIQPLFAMGMKIPKSIDPPLLLCQHWLPGLPAPQTWNQARLCRVA
jgi:hypothetical protein